MPVFLDTIDNMVETSSKTLAHGVCHTAPASYNISIGGVAVALRPTEPLRRHDQSHSGEGCWGSWLRAELAKLPVQNRSQSSG